ncbi:MAG: response regulator [Myxococcales bacterium]|nr:response regulator [Myxococcales bacterium]
MATELPPRLLVVDDDADIVRLVTLAMRSRGYVVEGVTTLPEAMSLIDSTAYDVVLTDKNLKGATGLELIDALTLRAPATAVVLMTAYPEGALGRLASLDGYIGKPFKSLELVAQSLQDARERRQRSIERQKMMGKLGEVNTALASSASSNRAR